MFVTWENRKRTFLEPKENGENPAHPILLITWNLEFLLLFLMVFVWIGKKTDGQKHGVPLQQKSIFHLCQSIFLKFSQSFKTERFYRQSVSLKKKPEGLALFCLTIKAGGEWCLPQVENTCSTSPPSPPLCSPPRPGLLLLSMLSAV